MKYCIIFALPLLWAGCANIVPPSGGPTDKEMPTLISTIAKFNEDYSEKNIIFKFNEKIEEYLFRQNFYSSPPLKEITHNINGNELDITIKDSISSDIKYIVNLNNCIKDITEGNVLNKLEYVISPTDTTINFYHLNVKVENSLTKKAAENNWVLLYDKGVPDSLIFKTNPSYVSKTDKDGVADFNNLKNGQYKIISLSGDDYIYHEDDIISFSDELIIAGTDTTIYLLTFDPLYKIDSVETIKDTTNAAGGSLTLKSDFSGYIIVQLLK